MKYIPAVLAFFLTSSPHLVQHEDLPVVDIYPEAQEETDEQGYLGYQVESNIVALLKLRLMLKYRPQLELAIELDRRLRDKDRGHERAVMYVIDTELLYVLEQLSVDDPIDPLAVPEDTPID